MPELWNMLRRLQEVVSSVVHVLMTVTGATDDSSLYWAAVFERKILKGDVGISIRWSHSKKIDVQWELQQLVRSLSLIPSRPGAPSPAPSLFTKDTDYHDLTSTSHADLPPDTHSPCDLTHTYLTSSVDPPGIIVHTDLSSSVDPPWNNTFGDLNTSPDGNFNVNYWLDGSSVNNLDQEGRLRTSVSYANLSREKDQDRLDKNLPPRCRCLYRTLVKFTDLPYDRLLLSISTENYKSVPGSPNMAEAQKNIVGGCHRASFWSKFKHRTRRSYSCPNLHGSAMHEEIKLVIRTRSMSVCSLRQKEDELQRNEYLMDPGSANMYSHKQGTARRCEFQGYATIRSDSANENLCRNTMSQLWKETATSLKDIHKVISQCDFYNKEQIKNVFIQEEISPSRTNFHNQYDGKCKNNDHDNNYGNDTSDQQHGVKGSSTWDLNSARTCSHRMRQRRQTTQCLGDSQDTSLFTNSEPNEKYCGMSALTLGPLDGQDRVHHGIMPHQTRKLRSLGSSRWSATNDPELDHSCRVSHTGTKTVTQQSPATPTHTRDLFNQVKMSSDCQQATPWTPAGPYRSVESSVKSETDDLPIVSLSAKAAQSCYTLPLENKSSPDAKVPQKQTAGEHQSTLARFVRSQLSSISTSIGRWTSRWTTAGSVKDSAPVGRPQSASRLSRSQSERDATVMYYLTGRSAYLYYRLLTRTEARYKRLCLEAEWNHLKRLCQSRQEALIHVVSAAREYYSNPKDTSLNSWKSLRKSMSKGHNRLKDAKQQAVKTPDYVPYFTISLITVEIVLLALLFFRHGLADLGVNTVVEVHTGVPTFLGTESFRSLREPNPWVGPPVDAFIEAGATVGACMWFQQKLAAEAKVKDYKAMVPNNQQNFGCCEMRNIFNRAGTTTQLECVEMTSGLGQWRRGLLCSQRPSTQNSIAHVIKPCCIRATGQCSMTSLEHCLLLRGTFHSDCDHCVQVNCLNDLCQLSSLSGLVHDPSAPWLPGPDVRWQWWRLLTAVPLVHGLLQLLALVPVQLSMMMTLEMSVGWHRVILIYISSAFMGELVGGRLHPFTPQVGLTGGVGGVVGVAVLELVQAWRYLQYPGWEAGKLMVLVLLLSFLGTFHLFGLFSFWAGLGLGMVVGLVVLPYLSLGRSYLRGRLLVVALLVLLVLLGVLQMLLSLLDNCGVCGWLECVPYTSSLCKTYS